MENHLVWDKVAQRVKSYRLCSLKERSGKKLSKLKVKLEGQWKQMEPHLNRVQRSSK